MKISRYTKLGIIIVFSFTVLVWGLSYLKGNDIFTNKEFYHVYYNRVDGLVPSNKVTINGFQIGQVQEVNFAPGHSGKLMVTFSVEPEFKIPVGSVAHIVSSDIMGTRAIEIVLSEGSAFYNANDTIPGAVEKDLKEQVSMQVLPLKNKAEELLGTIDSAMTVLTVIFNEEARENLSASFANINRTIGHIEKTTADLQEIVAEEKQSIKKIVTNIDEVTTTFKNNADRFDATIKNLNTFSDSLSVLSLSPMLTNLNAATQNMLSTLEKLNSSDNSAGLLLNDDHLYSSISILSDNLGSLISDIQQNPKRYVQFSAFDFGKEIYVNTKDDNADKNIIFKIHLVASRTRLDSNSKIFDGIKGVEEFYSNGIYSYLAGSTGVYSEILDLHRKIKQQFPEASIVAFKKGRLIKLEKAIKSAR